MGFADLTVWIDLIDIVGHSWFLLGGSEGSIKFDWVLVQKNGLMSYGKVALIVPNVCYFTLRKV